MHNFDMKALTKQARRLLGRVGLHAPSQPDPEPVYCERRPYKSFFDSLTPEQQKKALAYRGPENHGPAEFRSRKAHAYIVGDFDWLAISRTVFRLNAGLTLLTSAFMICLPARPLLLYAGLYATLAAGSLIVFWNASGRRAA